MDVFISYSKDEKPAAEELARALEEHGIHTWADFKDLHAGQRWQDEIERAAGDARQFLILVSPDSSSTPLLEAEWRTILSKAWADSRKSVIPILFGSGDPPAFLRNWVPLRVNPETDSAKWTSRVLEVMRSHRKRTIPPSVVRRIRAGRLEEVKRDFEELQQMESAPRPAHIK